MSSTIATPETIWLVQSCTDKVANLTRTAISQGYIGGQQLLTLQEELSATDFNNVLLQANINMTRAYNLMSLRKRNWPINCYNNRENIHNALLYLSGWKLVEPELIIKE